MKEIPTNTFVSLDVVDQKLVSLEAHDLADRALRREMVKNPSLIPLWNNREIRLT